MVGTAFLLRGRSQTTFTRFGFFWPPTPLRLHFLWYNGLQKINFFDHLPPSSCKRSLWTPSYGADEALGFEICLLILMQSIKLLNRNSQICPRLFCNCENFCPKLVLTCFIDGCALVFEAVCFTHSFCFVGDEIEERKLGTKLSKHSLVPNLIQEWKLKKRRRKR